MSPQSTALAHAYEHVAVNGIDLNKNRNLTASVVDGQRRRAEHNVSAALAVYVIARASGRYNYKLAQTVPVGN